MKIRTIFFAALLTVPAGRAFAQSTQLTGTVGLKPSGPLDRSFGTGGVVVTATAPGSGADVQNGIAIQPDGKILVGGESDMGDDEGGFQWRITRYTRNGNLDTSFGSGGTVLTSMSSIGEFDERLIALALQDDGKIVAAGWVENPLGVQNSALVRYNSDGTLDTTFGSGGKVVTDVASEPDHDFINQVVIDSSGRIVVAGGCRTIFLGRYLPGGTLDPSFNTAGPRPGLQLTEVRTGETNSEILDMTLDDSGRIVAAGYSTTFDGTSFHVDSAVARFRTDGTLDPSFNPNGPRPGVAVTPVSPDFDVNFRVAIDDQDRIVAAGDAFVGVGSGFFDIMVSRYLADGTLDASFGDGGVVVTNLAPGDSDDDVQGLVVLHDGKILVGGSAAPTAFLLDSDFAVARFLSNGDLDGSFGNGGIAITPTAPGDADDEIFSMAFQGGNKVIAAGQCEQPATGRDVCVVRYKLGGAGN